MAFLDFLFGKRQKTQQFQHFTPQQNQYLDQLLGGAQSLQPQAFSFLQNLLNPSQESQDQFNAPYLRQFYEDIIPTIAERFTSIGGQRSSAFPQALGKAGAGLIEQLAALRGQQAFQGLGALQNFGSTGLAPRFENVYRPRDFGLLGTGLHGLLSGLGQSAGSLPALLKGFA